ncbi:MAG: hypothetical protein OEY38_11725 [Gammaproteobacteria bacterium]|nr:hypothetical protein [Gammaproteobacteria bacterium]
MGDELNSNPDEIPVSTGVCNELEIKTITGDLLEVEDAHFHHDSAVMLPDYDDSSDQSGASQSDKITGLAVLKTVFLFASENPEKQAFITGHTDTSGEKLYNVELSNLRANNVYYLLTDRRDDWVDIALLKSKVEDYQQIFKWLFNVHGWPCDPGKKDNVLGPKTKAATKEFQITYNNRFEGTIAENGIVNADTWGAIFDVYIDTLIKMLDTDDSGYVRYQKKLKFTSLSRAAVGCGEYFPLEAKGKDNYRSQKNRRVEVIFFDKTEKPALNCHSKPGYCEPEKCHLYDETLYKFNPIDCQPVPIIIPPHKVTITSIDSLHFVPEIEELIIDYEIEGALSKVKKVSLIVTPKSDSNKEIFSKDLPAPYRTENQIKWKGDVTDGAYPGYLTLKDAPYEIKLKLENTEGASCTSDKKPVELHVKKVDIQIEDYNKANIANQHKALVNILRTETLANAGKGRISLLSPYFKKQSSEMNDDSSFQIYKTAWAEGPDIPIVAKIWLKKKDGSQYYYDKSLKGAKVLWNLSLLNDAQFDSAMVARTVHHKARNFIRKVSAYQKGSSEPHGRTAHTHFGGVRNTQANRNADQKQWRESKNNWPFSEPGTRKWCAYSECDPIIADNVDSGILFRGGRIAADCHKIQAFVEQGESLDTADEAKLTAVAAEQKSNVLELTNMRKVWVNKNYKIGAATAALSVPVLDNEYKKGGMTIQTKPGAPGVQEIQAQWRANYQAVINPLKLTDDFIKHAIEDDPLLYPVRYKSFQDYWNSVQSQRNVFGQLWHRILRMFGAGDEDDYRAECDKYSYPIYTQVAKRFPLDDGGLTFFKFGANGSHNQWRRSYTAGIAPYIPGYSGRRKAVFFVFQQNASSDTFIHEVGHHLFLAHGPGHFNAGSQPAGYQPNAHDELEFCVMSYHGSNPTNLCGICQLKLAGWDYLKVNKDGTVS